MNKCVEERMFACLCHHAIFVAFICLHCMSVVLFICLYVIVRASVCGVLSIYLHVIAPASVRLVIHKYACHCTCICPSCHSYACMSLYVHLSVVSFICLHAIVCASVRLVIHMLACHCMCIYPSCHSYACISLYVHLDNKRSMI